MKRPKMKSNPAVKEKPKGAKSGVNKKVTKESVPQRVAENRYGQPTPRQKL